jgi:hypothetical protein
MSNKSTVFSPQDHWKALVLYGLNTATYKIAFGKTLLNLSAEGITTVPWEVLSRQFLDQYIARLSVESPMPQLDQPGRVTVMERVVAKCRSGNIGYDEAIEMVGRHAFDDVVPRFQNLGRRSAFTGMFYEFTAGQNLVLTDDLLKLSETNREELEAELDARWGLLEGAFKIGTNNFQLNNDLRLIYIENGYERTSITKNIPFLQGYQGNTCFYCGEPIRGSDTEVDHVLPRQVIQHDEIWNLALAHSICNGQKIDRLCVPLADIRLRKYGYRKALDLLQTTNSVVEIWTRARRRRFVERGADSSQPKESRKAATEATRSGLSNAWSNYGSWQRTGPGEAKGLLGRDHRKGKRSFQRGADGQRQTGVREQRYSRQVARVQNPHPTSAQQQQGAIRQLPGPRRFAHERHHGSPGRPQLDE